MSPACHRPCVINIPHGWDPAQCSSTLRVVGGCIDDACIGWLRALQGFRQRVLHHPPGFGVRTLRLPTRSYSTMARNRSPPRCGGMTNFAHSSTHSKSCATRGPALCIPSQGSFTTQLTESLRPHRPLRHGSMRIIAGSRPPLMRRTHWCGLATSGDSYPQTSGPSCCLLMFSGCSGCS